MRSPKWKFLATEKSKFLKPESGKHVPAHVAERVRAPAEA